MFKKFIISVITILSIMNVNARTISDLSVEEKLELNTALVAYENKQFDTAIPIFKKYHDVLEAQEKLGNMYHYGYGVDKNLSLAVILHAQAGMQGGLGSQLYVGMAFMVGEGVRQDYQEAMKWYEKAALQNDDSAQYFLGSMNYSTKNYIEAVKWYKKSAENNCSNAQFDLANLYLEGKGVEQNYQSAIFWLEKASNQNHYDAIRLLANLYEHGDTTIINKQKAKSWYKKACEIGDYIGCEGEKRMEKSGY
ncbi:tetratricopeptide repeat protein [Pasteurella testudinis]|uniref:tetratricopeptide repeat protein n=1 Tax=Pasteurella testudinis TaxID=761 RepID=UPI001356D606|nr:tetratricopeptide repeat protein [Pasteurella testudinis]